jgi:hypothetical protein
MNLHIGILFMKSRIFAVLIALFIYVIPTFSAVGESSVITLVFPFGARNTGMGEVGTSLADDDAALFYNPAGLGIPNSLWNDGSVSGFYEQLLPSFNILDLWHASLSSYYQPPNKILGGFGLFINYINMGDNSATDAYGHELGVRRSWERVVALGWGFNLGEYGDTSDNFGITAKFINSFLAPGLGENGEGTAQSFAFDFGYLRLFRSGLRLGVTFVNMGPNVFYIDHSNPDPIPFTVNLALGYKRRFFFDKNSNISIAAETRFDREIVHNDYNGNPDPFYKALYTDFADNTFRESIEEVNVHIGTEIGIMNTGFIRHGFLIDYAGVRYEETFGFGLKLFNHFNWDYSYIRSPEGFMENIFGHEGSSGVRDGQWRIAFTYSSALRKMSEVDSKWWRSM